MPKIRKKTSKRVGFREKYSVLKKVKEHHRKIKKQAKKFAAAGIVPKKSKNAGQIPNSFPNKELLINEMEAEFQMLADEREARKKEMKDNAIIFSQSIKEGKVEREAPDENEATGGLTKEQMEEAEMIIDPEGAQSIRCAAISKKGQWREVKKVVDLSDVILQVIDARDPISGRCAEIEAVVKENGKKIIYILNKIDLVPNAQEWVNYFKAENQTCIMMQATRSKDEDDEEENLTKLMALLSKYAKKFAEKKSKEQIVVGVVGFTNSGKSSLINKLKSKVVCNTGSQQFITQKMQQVPLNRQLLLLDSPGIIMQNKVDCKSQTQYLRSQLQIDEIMFPVEPVEEIMQKIDKVEVLRFYRIPDFETTVQMLENIAVKKGLVDIKEVETEKKESLMVPKKNKMKKKSQPVVEVQKVANVEQAAKRVIRDFLNNRLTYYTKVPTA